MAKPVTKKSAQQNALVAALSNEVKEKLAAFISEKIDELPEMFENLPNKAKIDALTKFLPYVTPKMSERAVTSKISVTVQDELKKLSQRDEWSVKLSDIPEADIIEDDFEVFEDKGEDVPEEPVAIEEIIAKEC